MQSQSRGAKKQRMQSEENANAKKY
jgi:hypothetical protein